MNGLQNFRRKRAPKGTLRINKNDGCFRMKSKVDASSHLWIKDIRENDVIRDSYLVREKRGGTTRRGEAFLSLILADKTGELEAKIWDRVQELSPVFQEGYVIEVEGGANAYRGQGDRRP